MEETTKNRGGKKKKEEERNRSQKQRFKSRPDKDEKISDIHLLLFVQQAKVRSTWKGVRENLEQLRRKAME